MPGPKIILKRIYAPYSTTDGHRVLVDRLWSRGLKKTDVRMDEWAKDLAPSTELRVEYNHQPERWKEFRQKYHRELNNNEHVNHYLDKWEDKRKVTLLYASKDPKYTHAQVLRDFFDDQYRNRG